jgi:antitoxin (DNA-binding transcriptional repressor) of toxin-antitoxin stability system
VLVGLALGAGDELFTGSPDERFEAGLALLLDGILRRVAAGEAVEVTDRGRPVAILLRTMPSGLARLEREGLLREAQADLLDLRPVRPPAGSAAPSAIVSEGRDE